MDMLIWNTEKNETAQVKLQSNKEKNIKNILFSPSKKMINRFCFCTDCKVDSTAELEGFLFLIPPISFFLL